MISQQGLSKLKEFEGFRSKAYKPVATEQYWTIGYGHYGPDVSPNDVWSEEKATEVLMNQDLPKFTNHVESYFPNLNQHQKDAMISFCYNLGFRTDSTLYQKIKSNPNDDSIKAEFLKWNKAGGKTLSGLTKRRQWEAQWFFAMTPTEDIVTEKSLQEQAKDSSGNKVLDGTLLNSPTSKASDIVTKTYNVNINYSKSTVLPPEILEGGNSSIVLDDLGFVVGG